MVGVVFARDGLGIGALVAGAIGVFGIGFEAGAGAGTADGVVGGVITAGAAVGAGASDGAVIIADVGLLVVVAVAGAGATAFGAEDVVKPSTTELRSPLSAGLPGPWYGVTPPST